MNTISIEYMPPHYQTRCYDDEEIYISIPMFKIFIDGKDLFKFKKINDRYESVALSDFIFNDEYDPEDYCLNGCYLIGVCSACGCEGCDDLFVNISTKKDITKWEILPDRLRHIKIIKYFDTNLYKDEIMKLRTYYLSFSWEDYNHKLERLCNDYIKNYQTKDGQSIFGVKFENAINETRETEEYYTKIMEVYYYGEWEPMGNGRGRPYKSINIEWDGKTIENALEKLKTFAKNELLPIEDPSKIYKKELVLYIRDETI